MASEKFPVDEAQLVALFMECIFYGIYLVTFFSCMRALLWSEGRFKPFAAVNTKMVVAALGMLVFGTLDLGFGLRHNLEAFIYSGRDPELHFAETSYWINVMKMVTYVSQTFIGDGILIYRCWIVYNRNWWIIILPILLWLSETACGAVTAYIEATLLDESAMLNSNQLIPFISSMLSLTLATNLLTTGLIVYRIWSIQNSLRHRGTASSNGSLERLIRILIESGLLYTLSIIILFGCYLTSNNAQLGVSDSVVQIIGITFNLVIISVDPGSSSQSTVSRGGPTLNSHHVSSPTSYTNQSRYMINIERSVVHHGDIEGKGESRLNDVPLDSMRLSDGYVYK